MAGHSAAELKQGLNPYNVLVLVFLGLGSLTYGYTASIIGTTLGQPSFVKYMGLDKKANANDLIATTNGLFQAGGTIGALCLPYFCDKFGRRWGVAVPAILAIISGAMLAGSVNIGMFIAFRFVAGAAAFMVLAATPLLMGEIVPAQFRGALVDMHGVLLVLGYTIQGFVGYGFFFWDNPKAWRPPLAIQCFFPLCLLVALPWLPESPRWLCLQGRGEEARQVLIKLHSNKNDPNHDAAEAEYYQINQQIAIDKTLGSSWKVLFTKPSYRKRAFLAIGTTGIIQCSGVLVINNYGPTLYGNLGFSPQKSLLYAAAWLLFATGMNVMGMFLVDRFNRPKYMACGVFGCMVTLIVEAALVAQFVPSNNEAALKAAVAMFFVYQIFYGACLDGTQFSYLGEIFPTHLRAKGLCLGVSMISFCNVVWLQAAPSAFAHIGWKFYLCFIIPGQVKHIGVRKSLLTIHRSIGAAIMFFFFPNTKGLPLEECAAIFGDADEVAVYQRDIDVDDSHHIVDRKGSIAGGRNDSEKGEAVMQEKIGVNSTGGH